MHLHVSSRTFSPRATGVAALAVAAALGLTACSNGSDPGGSTTSAGAGGFHQKSPLKFGYSAMDLSQPYWQTYAEGIHAEAKKYGASVVDVDQKSSEQAQVSGGANLINQGISGLIVSPIQPEALPATITAAHNQKIPVVIGDVGTAGAYDAYVTSDNRSGGTKAAEFVINKLKAQSGTHKVGLIGFGPGQVVGEDRIGGFKDAIAKDPRFKVVATLDGKATVQGGFQAAQNMLSANPDLQAIFCANDPEAEGAVRALQAVGKSAAKGFVLVGFNGDAPALSMVQKRQMTATIAQDPYAEGQLAVRTALNLLKGKPVSFTDEKSKTLLVPVTLVDQTNVAKFLSATHA